MDGNTTEIVHMVLEFLEKTAIAVIHVGFQISVKYVIADAVASIVKFCVMLALSVTSGKLSVKAFSIADKEGWGDDGPSFNAVKAILTVAFFVAVVITTLCLLPFDAIRKLMAPEWYAILNVIELVK